MTSPTIHKERIVEHLQAIETAIAVGIEKRPATIGLHTSACSMSLLELYLHLSKKISAGTTLKHDWFKRPKPNQKIVPLAERKMKADFPDKEKIFSLLYTIEEDRNKLIYGNPPHQQIERVLRAFQELHRHIKEKIAELGEEIE